MAEAEFNVVSQSPVVIRGISTIDHKIRRKLGITCDEYVLLDYIHSWRNAKGTQRMSATTLEAQTGFSYKDYDPMLRELAEKGMILQTKIKGIEVIVVSELWKQHFPDDSDFDNPDPNNLGFWQIYGKVGNRKMAMEKYFQVRKKVSKERLHKLARDYVRHCNSTGTFMKLAQTWLNPEKEHWNDNVVNKPLQPGEEQKSNVMKGNFYGES